MPLDDIFLDLPSSPDDESQAKFGLDFTEGIASDSDYTFTRTGQSATVYNKISDRYIDLHGVSGSYISTVDSPDIDLTNNVRLEVEAAAADWTPSSEQTLFSKWSSAGQRSFKLSLATSGKLRLYYTTEGTTAVTAESSVATGLSDGTKKHLAATLAISTDGTFVVDFETSDTGITWAALGSTITGGGGGSGGASVIHGRFSNRPTQSTWVAPYDSFKNWHNPFQTWLGRNVKASNETVFLNAGTTVDEELKQQRAACGALLSGWWAWQQAAAGRIFIWNIGMGAENSAPSNSLQLIASGTYDAHFQTLADRIFSVTGTATGMIIRIGHEMDGNWYGWGNAGPGGVQAPYFAAAFRRIVTLMRNRQPTNQWKFAICPTDRNISLTWLNQIWPGDAYVDYMGVDTYDTAHLSPGSYAGKNQSARITEHQTKVWPWRLAKLNIYKDFSVAHGKPIQFHEWGLFGSDIAGQDDQGGLDNTDFIQKMFDWMTDPANNVHTQMYWDKDTYTSGVLRQKIQMHGPLSTPSTFFPNSQALYRTLFRPESGSGTAAGINLFVSTANLDLGAAVSGASEIFNGKIYSAKFINDRTNAVVALFDADLGAPTNTSILSPTETWSLNGEAKVVAVELETVSADVARIEYDSDTVEVKGLLLEEQRINAIRNSTMQGAVVGTPGTPPTNWQNAGVQNGLTREITGFGTEAGMSYIEMLFTGTPSGTGKWGMYFESTTNIAASSGQVWTGSFTYKVIGTPTGVNTVNCEVTERNGSGTFLTSSEVTEAPTANALRRNFTVTRTLSNGACAFTVNDFTFSYTNGVAVNLRIRVYTPQCEQGGSRTSFIPTSTVAVTRGADIAVVSSISSIYSAGGTVYTEILAPDDFNTASDAYVFSFNDGTTNEVIGHTLEANTRVPKLKVIDGGVQQQNLSAGSAAAASAGETLMVTSIFKTGNFKISARGGVSGSDATGTMPAPDRLHIGSRAGTDGFLNAHFRRQFYFQSAFAAATIETLSSTGPSFTLTTTPIITPEPSNVLLTRINNRILSLEALRDQAISVDNLEDALILEIRINALQSLIEHVPIEK